MADRLMGGQLAATLIELRTSGQSFERIAAELQARGGVLVSAATVAVWFRQLGIETAVPERSAS